MTSVLNRATLRAIVVVSLALTMFVSTAPKAEAATPTASEKKMLSYVNQVRKAYGRRAVYLSPGLSDIARAHSRRMRSSGRLYHSNLTYIIRNWNWTRAGENVGRGGSVYRVHRAFMGSYAHRVTIVNRSYRRVGIGIVWSGSTAYVTEIFTN